LKSLVAGCVDDADLADGKMLYRQFCAFTLQSSLERKRAVVRFSKS